MSYEVNPKTLLFEDLTATEALELKVAVEALIVTGERTASYPPFVEWCKAANADQSLMVMATVFPQRALLSIIKHADRDSVVEDPRDSYGVSDARIEWYKQMIRGEWD